MVWFKCKCGVRYFDQVSAGCLKCRAASGEFVVPLPMNARMRLRLGKRRNK